MYFAIVEGYRCLLLFEKLIRAPLVKEKLKSSGITIFVLLLGLAVGHQLYKTSVDFGGLIGLFYGLSIAIIIVGWFALNLYDEEWKKD